MDILNLLEESTSSIVVTGYSNKLSILKKLNNIDEFIDVNFITLDEFTKRYYFSYDENAIYYLMDKYGFNRDIAGIYLSNMYYVLDKDYSNDKLNILVKLKKELDSKGLLIKDNLFENFIKDKKIPESLLGANDGVCVMFKLPENRIIKGQSFIGETLDNDFKGIFGDRTSVLLD